ncbi:hypothetical protein D9M68_447930 [compost metagenome]
MLGVGIGDGHEEVDRGLQEAPRERRGLAAGQPRHHRIDAAGGAVGPAAARALQQAVGLLGLDDDQRRPRGTITLPQMAGHTGREPADAALHDDVGEGTRRAGPGVLEQFVHEDAVALHHVTRNLFVAFVGGVGNHLPAVRLRQPRGLFHRGVVVAGDAHDLGAERGDGRLALFADLRVQHDHAATAHALRGRGQCATVVAVGRADGDEVAQRRRVPAREQVGGCPAPLRPAAQHQAQQGHGRAEHLEAAERGAPRFVLDGHLRDAQLRGEPEQRPCRRRLWCEPVPGGQPLAALAAACDVHDGLQGRVVAAPLRVGIGEEHGKKTGKEEWIRRRRAREGAGARSARSNARPWSAPRR